jgi:iron complex outermembrane receptor protein
MARRIPLPARIAPLALLLGLGLLVSSVQGAAAGIAGGEPLAPENAILEVRIHHAETGEPVAGALVRLRQLERGALTDATGTARLEGLPARVVGLSVEHLGFAPVNRDVTLLEGEVQVVEVALRPTALLLSGIVVTGSGRARTANRVYRPTTSLSGRELERSLASNLPATLSAVPGFHAQYNGPGASSPTIRGMGGDRVLMLEDGNRVGDLYQTASDHGVMVEPLTAQRVEVVRGPAGLLYGSNALGGVVNVVRDDVPRSRPAATAWTVSSQLESASPGGGVSVVGLVPVGGERFPLTLRAEASARRMDNARTPLGELDRTDLRSWNGSLGASWTPEWGFAGAAVRAFDNTYGVPGEFGGVLIPGGHPGGVDIETRRTTARFRAGYLQPLGFFESVEADAAVVRYLHDEIEALLDGRPVLGARFRQTAVEANLVARHDHALHEHSDAPLRAEGAFSAAFQYRDLVASGSSPGARSGEDLGLALIAYEEFQRGPFRLEGGLRWDHRRLEPRNTDSIRVRTQQREVVKPVSRRTFGSISGSLAALADVTPGWTTGVSVARSTRVPSLEELFSDGPHLADFSFDIGSPDLEPERGLGVDLFVRGGGDRVNLEAAVFANWVDGFIYYAQTGETVRVIRDGVAPRTTPVYEARGDDALFTGVEGRIQWEAVRNVVLDLTASYTRATRRSEGDPLPSIPPLNGRAELRWESGPWFASAGLDGALRQSRVPRPVQIGEVVENPQDPTPGYGLVNAGLGWRTTRGGTTHALTLQGQNLTDRVWRDHLSRIKDIAPQPGRNLQFTYRVHF